MYKAAQGKTLGIRMFNAGINFIHNHPDTPRDTTWREQKPFRRDNHCVQEPSPRDRTGSQKPHPRDIKLENFTNISMNSDTIWNEKLSTTNKTVIQWSDWLLKYISFDHQSQTIERIKDLYDMYKCMLFIFWGKGAWNFTKNISTFLLSFFIVRVFIVIKKGEGEREGQGWWHLQNPLPLRTTFAFTHPLF